MDTPKTLTGRDKRRRCLNCGGFFPITKQTRKFCDDECRTAYHRFGSFGKFMRLAMAKVEKEVARQFDARFTEFAKNLQLLTRPELDQVLIYFVTRQELTPEGIGILKTMVRRRHQRAAEAQAEIESTGVPSANLPRPE